MLSLRFFAVQFRGEAAGSEGELDEASAGGDDDKDGGTRQRVHEGQTEGRSNVCLLFPLLLPLEAYRSLLEGVEMGKKVKNGNGVSL